MFITKMDKYFYEIASPEQIYTWLEKNKILDKHVIMN